LPTETDAAIGAPTVFLSYASEDREAARRIGAALPGYGLEVWYDESELGGGDAWDQKIRRQIRECDYFMALVSAHTEARREGYFRREWRLATERTLDMADDHPFLLPITIDDTDAHGARVPEKFQAVQWLKVPDGNPTQALEMMCRRLAAGVTAPPAPRVSLHPGGRAPMPPDEASGPTTGGKPRKPDRETSPFVATPFPVYDSKQRVRFGFEALGWISRNTYALFIRLPRWVRYVIIVWIVIALVSRGNSTHEDDHDISPATKAKLNSLANQYKKDPTINIAKLGAMVASELGDSSQPTGVSILALPFIAPPQDEAAVKLANSVAAQVYMRVAIARHANLIAADAAPESCALDALLGLGHSKNTQYVLCGRVDAAGATQALSLALIDAKKNKMVWTGAYAVGAADPDKVALDVVAHVPKPDDDD
jgi:TolB-like protein